MRMAAAEFRVRFFDLLDQVRDKRQEIVLTKHGRPVAKLVPIDEATEMRWGCMEGTATLVGDASSPVFPPLEEWFKPAGKRRRRPG